MTDRDKGVTETVVDLAVEVVDVISSVPEAGGAILDVASEAAGAVLEGAAHVIGAIFEGL